MKKVLKKIIITIVSILALLMLTSQLLFNDPLSLISIPVWIVEVREGIDEQRNKAIRIEEESREENRVVAEKWVRDTYGATLSEVIKLEYHGRSNGWGVDSVYGMVALFARGTVFVDSETKAVEGGFNLEGNTFQHLYSEWVKKQVGIDDENVEFGFAGNFDTPYIEFDKITSLSDDYREVFENTHNLYLDTIIVNNNEINENNYIEHFNNIKDEIYNKCYRITGKPKRPYSLFVYIDDYRLIYNFPEEVIASISKKNKNPKDYGGSIWSSIKIK